MKKILIIILCLALSLSFTACDMVTEDEDMSNISDLRNYMLVGNSDNYYVEMYGGLREAPLLIDGAVGKMQPYMKLKVLAKSGVESDYTYHIGINEKEYEGNLTKEYTSGCYSVIIEVSELDPEYVLKITCDGKEEEITMKTLVTADMMTWSEARKCAEIELASDIEKMCSEDKDYEMYVKFIEGEVGSKQFFWYVSFMSGDKLIAVLIDPATGKVIAKRC